MLLLFLKAYWMLIVFDFYLARHDFPGLYNKVRKCPLSNNLAVCMVPAICEAIDTACIWYWKQALCLQRSAATAVLLKRHGVLARMVIGIQHIPFKAHAWVEVDGKVVNDNPDMRHVYSAIDHC